MMINTIGDMIEHLRKIRDQKGDLLIRTQLQVPLVINVETKLDTFSNESKSLELNVLLIKGYKE